MSVKSKYEHILYPGDPVSESERQQIALLETIGHTIGYGRSIQILEILWGKRLAVEDGLPEEHGHRTALAYTWGRREALEKAAMICDDVVEWADREEWRMATAGICADKIRALNAREKDTDNE